MAPIRTVHTKGLFLGQWSAAQGITWYGADAGLPEVRITDLVLDHNETLWVATRKGVFRFDGTRFNAITREHGLPSDHVHCLCPVQHGRLWIGTDAGPAVYNGRSVQALESLQLGTVTSIIEDHDGILWFATAQGVKHYTSSTHPPRTQITQVIADRLYSGTEAVRFPSSVPQVLFEFEGLSFRTPSRDMLYTYRLDGHDQAWSTPARTPRSYYHNLPSGTYTFQVKALDRDLNESAPTTLAFTVDPDPRDAQIDELERRVQERTVALEAANAQLTDSNIQLETATQRKSAFLASMSHDLRTPMNAIIGYTRILLRRTGDRLDDREQRNLQNIETSSNNLLSLINEILDLSRIEAGRIEVKVAEVDVQSLAETCAVSIAPLVKDGVEFRQELQAVPMLSTDGDLLQRVLMNLLGNAVKFTETGRITLSVRPVDEGVEVAVADTGVGIPDEDLPYIFEEFRQVDREGAEAQGSGLGLAIVKKTVELLGGTITAHSEVGHGTAFTLTMGNYAG